jgi:hypothetical protein
LVEQGCTEALEELKKREMRGTYSLIEGCVTDLMGFLRR